MSDNIVLRIATDILIPPILLFALYVHFHGDYGPGGGFQAGVVSAAALILYGLIHGLDRMQRVFPLRWSRSLAALGVLLYAGVGVAGVALGGSYLDYGVLRADPVHGQHLGILLVELGVLATVLGVMVTIFYAYVGRARTEAAKE